MRLVKIKNVSDFNLFQLNEKFTRYSSEYKGDLRTRIEILHARWAKYDYPPWVVYKSNDDSAIYALLYETEKYEDKQKERSEMYNCSFRQKIAEIINYHSETIPEEIVNIEEAPFTSTRIARLRLVEAKDILVKTRDRLEDGIKEDLISKEYLDSVSSMNESVCWIDQALKELDGRA